LSAEEISAINSVLTLLFMKTEKRKNKEGGKAVRALISANREILSYLKKIVSNRDFNYRTFGTAIEEHLVGVLVKIFEESGFIKRKADYAIAPHKNYFPDFELKTLPPIAIEFKSGNRNQNRNGKWVKVKNSENDMGTLSEWPKKIKRFSGNNIYYIFIIYNFDDRTKEISSIEIAPFYKFVGVNKDKLLKYREKDGNLRPKDFDVDSPIKTFKQFKELFNKTVVYRSKRIIKKHKLIIRKGGQDF
jgi:hypothetical protein